MNGDLALPAAFVDAVRDVAAVHAPAWEVAIEVTARPELPARVCLRHPLSSGHDINFSARQVDAIDLSVLESVVTTAKEFLQIARAPAVCPHARLLRGIRLLEETFEWPQAQVNALAGVLLDGGALTLEEFEWLRGDA